jgi:hypothetical protein
MLSSQDRQTGPCHCHTLPDLEIGPVPAQLVQVFANLVQLALIKTSQLRASPSRLRRRRSSEPFMPANVCGLLRLHAFVSPIFQQFSAARLHASSGARHRSHVFAAPRWNMKSAGIATRGQLSKDCACESELGLDYQVDHVVRYERVITRSRVHLNIRKAGALRFHRITSLTGAVKHECHRLGCL